MNRKGQARYYLLTIKIKSYSVMIDGKTIFDQPVKNDLKTYEDIGENAIGPEDDYTTGRLLDYNYFKNVIV